MPHKQVFISYHTSSSAETVRQICNILEERGISCWYAPRNVTGDYASSIVDAIDHCRVFLVILNKHANLSEDVRNEINCAFERVRQHEDMTILPFRVDDTALSAAIKYYLGRIHIMDGSIPPELIRIHELADRIAILLDQQPEKSAKITDERNRTMQYRVTGSMIYADKNFVGRKRELQELHESLSGPVNKAFLVGMGGIGKSEIAKTYCAGFRGDYDAIVWVSFDESLEKTLINDFAFPIDGLERNDFPDISNRDYFLKKLSILKKISDKRLLLILDNFDVPEDPDLEDFCSGSYSVIFTTRFRNISAELPEVLVEPVTEPADLLELFRTEYKRAGLKEEITQLLDFLDGHPLSIRLVAAAMQSNRSLSPSKMLALLKSGDAEMALHSPKATDLIFGRLQKVFHLSDLEETYTDLLKVLALVPLSGITVEEFFEWNGWDDYDIIDELINKSWIIHNPVSDEVHLHPIVAKICQQELQKDCACCSKYVSKLIEIAMATAHYSWQRWQQLIQFCDAACTHLPDSHPLKEQLLIATGSIFMGTQHSDRSIEIFRTLLHTTNNSETKLFLYHKLSHMQIQLDDAEGSLQTAKEGYAFLQTLDLESLSLDSKYMKKVLIQRIGEASREIGDFETAIDFGKKAIVVCDEYSFNNPELSRGWALYHLAHSLLSAGQPDEAYVEINKALALFQSISDDWSVAFCYVLMGKIMYCRKQYDAAMGYMMDAWNIHMYHYSEDSKQAADLLLERGYILTAQGNKEDAIACFTRAADIYRNINFLKLENQALEAAKVLS